MISHFNYISQKPFYRVYRVKMMLFKKKKEGRTCFLSSFVLVLRDFPWHELLNRIGHVKMLRYNVHKQNVIGIGILLSCFTL